MRKVAVLLAAAVLWPSAVTGQTFEAFAGLSRPDSGESGIIIGAGVTFDVASPLDLRVAAQYTPPGGPTFESRPVASLDGESLQQIRGEQHYLVIPATAQLVTSLGPLRPFLALGAELAFEVVCSAETDTFTLDESGSGEVVGFERTTGDDCPETAIALFGLRGGGGIGIDFVGGTDLLLRADYIHGLTRSLASQLLFNEVERDRVEFVLSVAF